MSASQFGPRDESARPEPVDAPSGSADGRAGGRVLLEKVMEETERLLGREDALEPQQIAAIRAVARRRAGEGLILDPVLIELVEAVLSVQFRGLADGSPIWKQAARQIAQTLFDDPVARGRLEALWNNLSGGVG
jgi:hypothetical protein